jgi:hypothetical protein
MDQSKKTMRHFYCRDVLWETFEQMANDFDCSIDYLVNEAMRSYARAKNYSLPSATASSQQVPDQVVNQAMAAGGDRRPQAPGASTLRPPASPPPPPPAVPGVLSSNSGPLPRAPGGAARSPIPRPVAATPAPRATPEPMATQSTPTLYLLFNNQRISIDKDQFIIGRGSKTSDLPIKDGNISRKHAAVIRRNGTYYIKDLGSTNGIDYKGMRIDNKRIDEGDVFNLCDYELRFTYKA